MNQSKLALYLFGFVFIFFCLCPYLRIFGFNTTTQPNALVFSLVPIFLIKESKLPREIYIFLAVFLFATSILIFSGFTGLAARDWANYLSLILVTLASYKILNYFKGLNYKFFYAVVLMWLATGLIQTFVYNNFLSFMFSKMRGAFSNGRGITGLSTEPTYYGLIMALFLVIYLINGWYKKSKLLAGIILFQMVFLSKSSTAIMMFFIAIMAYFGIQLFRLNLKLALFIAFMSMMVFLLLSQTKKYYEETRVYEIAELVMDNPELILASDYSVSERVNHMVFPIIALFENYFMPHGFGKFGEYLSNKRDSGEYKVFFSHSYFNESKRILSGHGKGYFELGFFGLIISFGILLSFMFGFKRPEIVFAFIFFFMLLFAALPFMTATVPFVIGNILHIRKKNFT